MSALHDPSEQSNGFGRLHMDTSTLLDRTSRGDNGSKVWETMTTSDY